MRFTFEIEGVPQFDRSFNRVGKHVSDLRPVWEFAERAIYQIEEQQFKSEGSKGQSGKWPALSPEYAGRKAIEYPGKQILERTGKLKKSLTSKTSDTVLIKEKQEFGFGTSLFYAVLHQRGTKKMPPRQPFSFANDQRTFLTKEIQKGLLIIIRSDRGITLDVQ